ncbi:MAG: tRNA (N6-isopentenyl adenosine(37)-C2)-methylthiotransferase MiaB [Spirochaetales bacterium]|nr:tRNA (N6-isopentenyl adenosine(37)-C2)-methylthiotransferase MiaB [Spirochaetales bacterium]
MTYFTKKIFYLETYGCQMNFAESLSLSSRLTEAGWRESDSWEQADLVLLNTCAVRESAEKRIWGRLGFFGKQKKAYNFKIGFLGCMAERLQDEEMQKRAPFVDFFPGVAGRNAFIAFLTGTKEQDLEEFSFDPCYSQASDFRALIPIMHGCNNFCTYCIVPYVRGRELSRDPEAVFQECRDAVERGVKEITLLGQNVNSYASTFHNAPLTFPFLLEELLNRVAVPWLRFLSPHPRDFTPDLVRVYGQHKAICRQIHLPVQHGSDIILKRMNRQYTRSQYLELIDMIRVTEPDTSFSTDILIGFPGETEKDFQDTLDLMEKVAFDDAFTYFYNPREGTAAASFDGQLSLEVKKERLSQIISLQRQLTLRSRRSRIGREDDVLLEGVSKKRSDQLLGRTSRNEMVICPGGQHLVGTFRTVKFTGLSGITLKGEAV